MSTAEQILAEARTLPPEERRWLRDALGRELRPAQSYSTHERERAWIEQHRDEYLNQWVALDGDRLLAHGTDTREVYLAARAMGVRAPFLERVTSKPEVAFMGGWL